MFEFCNCDDIIEDIPGNDCPVNIGEIQKMAFADVNETGFDPEANINTLAFWETRIKDDGDQKITISPFIRNSALNPGDSITEDDLNNSQKVQGVNPTVFEGEIWDVSPEIAKALKEYICRPTTRVYLFNDVGEIIYRTSGTAAIGFDAKKLEFLDRSNAKNVRDKNILRFQLKYCWDREIKITKPNFDPLTDLDDVDLGFDNLIWSDDDNVVWTDDDNSVWST